ncbi:MAG: hypothetical protein QXZ13_03695 [Candidatus Diapherotrites archaeon]
MLKKVVNVLRVIALRTTWAIKDGIRNLKRKAETPFQKRREAQQRKKEIIERMLIEKKSKRTDRPI